MSSSNLPVPPSTSENLAQHFPLQLFYHYLKRRENKINKTRYERDKKILISSLIKIIYLHIEKRKYLVAKCLSDVLEEWRYLNLEVPNITWGLLWPWFSQDVSFFMLSSQVHLKIEQKNLCRTEKLLPITSTSETLRDKNDSTFFVSKQQQKNSPTNFDARNLRKCSPHTKELPKLKGAAQKGSSCSVYFVFSWSVKDIQLSPHP